MILYVLAVISCQKDLMEVSDIIDNNNFRTKEEAVDEIFNLWNTAFGASDTRSFSKTLIIDEISLITSTDTRGAVNEALDSVAYLVNFANDNGFAIVRADKRENPIVALTDKGYLDYEKLVTFPSENEFENEGEDVMYALLYNALVNNDKVSGRGVTRGGADYSDEWCVDENVSPMVIVKWGQSYPFNMLMRTADPSYTSFGKNTAYKGKMPTGCVMVAMAQLMVTNKHPAVYSGYIQSWSMENLEEVSRYDEYEFFDQYMDVNDMPEPIRTHIIGAADLMRTLANQLGASYTPSGTGAVTSEAMNMLATVIDPDFYGGYITLYQYAPDNLNYSIQESLSLSKPMIMKGRRQYYDTYGNLRSSGHAWIVDGYMNRHKNSADGILYENLIHMNWGWQGRCDGYFDYGILDIAQRVEQDDIDRHPGSLVNYNYNVSTEYYFY